MYILDYLTSNDFEFIDRVGYSTNLKVSRTVCFKRLTGRNSSSGKITYFYSGNCSYTLKSTELGCKVTKERSEKYASLEKLKQRITATFG